MCYIAAYLHGFSETLNVIKGFLLQLPEALIIVQEQLLTCVSHYTIGSYDISCAVQVCYSASVMQQQSMHRCVKQSHICIACVLLCTA